MTVKNISIGTTFRWIDGAFALLRRNPRTILGACALLLLVILVPAILQQVVLLALRPMNSSKELAVMLVFMLVNSVVIPPALGGLFRLLQACDRGMQVRATFIFDVYHEQGAASRMISIALISVVLYAAVLFVANAVIGDGYLVDLVKAVLSAQPGKPPILPAAPNGLLLWVVVFTFVLVVMATAYNLAMTQAAMTPRSPLTCIADGFSATLRNLAAFLGFYLVMSVVVLVVLLIVALAIGLIAVMLGLASKALAFLVVFVIYMGLMLLMYAIVFGVNYLAWRDTLGEGDTEIAQQIAA
ncbi:MAG: hypothetical protein ABI365_09185 [Lysobacteraceae bacterium]